MAWSTYILCAHGHGGEPLIRIIAGGERSEEKKIPQMLNVIQLSLKYTAQRDEILIPGYQSVRSLRCLFTTWHK